MHMLVSVDNKYICVCATIDNVCVPTGLETPVKLFSYPSYGEPNIGKFVEWLFGFLLLV